VEPSYHATGVSWWLYEPSLACCDPEHHYRLYRLERCQAVTPKLGSVMLIRTFFSSKLWMAIMRLLRHWCDGTENGRGAGRAVTAASPTSNAASRDDDGIERPGEGETAPHRTPPCLAPAARTVRSIRAATPFRFSVQLGDRRPRIDNRSRLRASPIAPADVTDRGRHSKMIGRWKNPASDSTYFYRAVYGDANRGLNLGAVCAVAGLIVVSTRVLLLPHGGPPVIDPAGASSLALVQ
jgi:hypothetical protein